MNIFPFLNTYRAKRRLFGVLFLLIGLFFAASLVGYHSADPSLNRASAAAVQNFMGWVGADLADLLLQTFGMGCLVLVLACFGWGLAAFRPRLPRHIPLRVLALLVGVILFDLFLSYMDVPEWWPIESGLGGALGNLLRQNKIMHGWLSSMYMFLSLFSSILLIPIGCGFKRKQIIRGFSYIWQSFMNVLLFSRWIGAVSLRSDEEEKPIFSEKKPKKPRTAKPEVVSKSVDAGKVVSRNQPKEKKQAALELRARQGSYTMPSYALLRKPPARAAKQNMGDSSLKQNAKLLESVLQDFGVQGKIINIRPGPVVTLYELEPSAGTKSSRVIGLADDIARSMSSISARISVIPGRNALGIELPNHTRETVYLRELLEDDLFTANKASLPLALGKDIGGEPIIVDLARMPHVLVAGTTGSGKSVAINTMVLSLVYHLTPDQCRFIMVDPKMLELSVYDGIPHLLCPVVTDPSKAVVALKWAVKEMENRYRLMSALGVRNIDNYNKRIKEAKHAGEVLKREVQTGFDPETGKPIMEEQEMDMNSLPFIVVIVDEMADLMLVAGKEIEGSIQRLAQMARAAGIHLIMATQRPSVDVITGVIKANFPTRISFQVTSKIDSRTILGEMGAEQLLGMGDMLYMAGGGRISRVHGPFASDKEVEEIVAYLRTQGEPSYLEEVTIDDGGGEQADFDDESIDKELYDRAVAVVVRDNKPSISYVQRCLKIGYNRAAVLIEKMERDGVVSAPSHAGKREVLARREEEY